MDIILSKGYEDIPYTQRAVTRLITIIIRGT